MSALRLMPRKAEQSAGLTAQLSRDMLSIEWLLTHETEGTEMRTLS
jgi:hypothetical protein